MLPALLAKIWPWLLATALTVCIGLWYGHNQYQRGYADRSLSDASSLATRLTEIQADADRQVRNLQTAGAAKDKELDYLRGLPSAVPVRVVRLCSASPAGATVPKTSAGATGQPAGAGVSSSVPRQNPDLGPALYDLADQYDKLVATVRASLAVCNYQGGN